MKSNNPSPVATRSFIMGFSSSGFRVYDREHPRRLVRPKFDFVARPIPSIRVSLSYGSLTEHVALHAARHAEGAGNRTKARDNALNAITRIRNDEAAGGGARQSCAGAIEDRPDAASSGISAKALGTRPGRRIKGGGANLGGCSHSRRQFRTDNWCGRDGDDSAEISSRITSSVENPRLIEGHLVRRCGAIF